MNKLTGQATMSSREIAELTSKRHSDVLRDIRNILSQLDDNQSERTSALAERGDNEEYHRSDRTQCKYLGEDTEKYFFNHAFNDRYHFALLEYIDEQGKNRPEYLLTKRDTLLLVSGYSIVLRAKIIDRWEELETKTKIDFSDPDTILMLAQNWKEERQKRVAAEKQASLLESVSDDLRRKNEVMKPKAELMDRVIDANQKIDVGQTAKILGLEFGRNTLFKKLREKGIFFKSRNEPKQQYVDRGYFELKEQWIENATRPFSVTKVLVTQRGLFFLSKIFEAKMETKTLSTI
jgi:phage antirepressor YoqD-like protein